jgi:Photosynthetic reaction centre cytochrome C subunit
MQVKKIPVMIGLSVFIFCGVAAVKPADDEHYKNLKVLSKDINSEQLERVMFGFERQLGVTCLYCHAPTKNVVPERVDFASDEKKEKLIAREMLKMTLKINRKYFNTKVDKKLNEVKPVIWCKTCHRGFPVPNDQ